MSPDAHRLVLLRHGETEWSKAGRHTSRTDLDLTADGRRKAAAAAPAVAALQLTDPWVVSSPRRRARDTAQLAGLHVDETTELLAEWAYGDYEGTTTDDIRRTVPDWLVWTHGCPGGESVAQVSARADRAVDYALARLAERDVVFVGHGHFSRAVITRWVELPLADGIRFAMGAATLAVCGFEHGTRQVAALGISS
ncbi:acid phosphatase [Mycobacterium sp. MYCO198283]|uniref:acid phosphatase n=1 Tax=Mycobacterium sp. MYCO198283 TaxID=2883505 RepID=UPI001E61B706|nr:acid phosphatase [Mycobacterium sp. MYCO198283]MCG5431584.1 acid phosphatase [Mycobacterium sp. MYCO198283]